MAAQPSTGGNDRDKFLQLKPQHKMKVPVTPFGTVHAVIFFILVLCSSHGAVVAPKSAMSVKICDVTDWPHGDPHIKWPKRHFDLLLSQVYMSSTVHVAETKLTTSVAIKVAILLPVQAEATRRTRSASTFSIKVLLSASLNF